MLRVAHDVAVFEDRRIGEYLVRTVQRCVDAALRFETCFELVVVERTDHAADRRVDRRPLRAVIGLLE